MIQHDRRRNIQRYVFSETVNDTIGCIGYIKGVTRNRVLEVGILRGKINLNLE